MKDILEKRIGELSVEAQKHKDAYEVLQVQVAEMNSNINKAANEYNVVFLKLEEAKSLLAEVVKKEAEGCQDAVCEQSAE